MCHAVSWAPNATRLAEEIAPPSDRIIVQEHRAELIACQFGKGGAPDC